MENLTFKKIQHWCKLKNSTTKITERTTVRITDGVSETSTETSTEYEGDYLVNWLSLSIKLKDTILHEEFKLYEILKNPCTVLLTCN